MEDSKRYVLTVEQYARRMNISLPLAYAMTEIQGFPVIKIGRRKLILIEPLEKWLSENAGRAVL